MLANIGYDPSKRIWDPEFFFNETQRMFKMALTSQEQMDQMLNECDLNIYKSYFYPIVKGSVCAALAATTMDRVSCFQLIILRFMMIIFWLGFDRPSNRLCKNRCRNGIPTETEENMEKCPFSP